MMKSIRVLITENCNASCNNCINREIRHATNYISVSRFKEVCQYFSKNGVRNIRIMGGEPTIHPNFAEITQIAQSYFERVTIFTNAINRGIIGFIPRESDGINYNFSFVNFLTEEKLLVNKSGSRTLEIVISRETSSSKVINAITRVQNLIDNNIIVALTIDCKENIFKYRDELVSIYSEVFAYCENNKYEVIQDHTLPICFVYGTNIPIIPSGAFCNVDCAGLVDSNCDVRFCNQNASQKIPLFEGNRAIPFQLIENMLLLAYYKTQVNSLEKICSGCPYYNRFCNGGCYIGYSNISREDILSNTQLPLM